MAWTPARWVFLFALSCTVANSCRERDVRNVLQKSEVAFPLPTETSSACVSSPVLWLSGGAAHPPRLAFDIDRGLLPRRRSLSGTP